MAATSAPPHRALAAHARSGPARIGPNALIQTRAAVRHRYGAATWSALRIRARLPAELPGEMIDERLFRRLVVALADELDARTAQEILYEAGARTADYVRRNRIPRLARATLRALPRPLSLRLLLRVIHRHGWTFLGSGRMEHDPHRIVLHDCPTCRDRPSKHPMGGFYVGAFQGLLAALVDPGIRVVETECIAQGAPSCVFVITTTSPTPPPSDAPPEGSGDLPAFPSSA